MLLTAPAAPATSTGPRFMYDSSGPMPLVPDRLLAEGRGVEPAPAPLAGVAERRPQVRAGGVQRRPDHLVDGLRGRGRGVIPPRGVRVVEEPLEGGPRPRAADIVACKVAELVVEDAAQDVVLPGHEGGTAEAVHVARPVPVGDRRRRRPGRRRSRPATPEIRSTVSLARSGAGSVWTALICVEVHPLRSIGADLVDDPLRPLARIPLGADEVGPVLVDRGVVGGHDPAVLGVELMRQIVVRR